MGTHGGLSSPPTPLHLGREGVVEVGGGAAAGLAHPAAQAVVAEGGQEVVGGVADLDQPVPGVVFEGAAGLVGGQVAVGVVGRGWSRRRRR